LAVIVRETASPHPSRFVNRLHETCHHPDLPDDPFFQAFEPSAANFLDEGLANLACLVYGSHSQKGEGEFVPVSVVVGGQFGSEGKGKVALEIARRDPSTVASVRVGGPNSGHTVIDRQGNLHALRQLPSTAVDPGYVSVMPPGSYIAPEILLQEIAALGLGPGRVLVHPNAGIVTEAHRRWEADGRMNESIGSTQSGTGAAVAARAMQWQAKPELRHVSAREIPELAPYLSDTTDWLHRQVMAGRRIVIEGTQGFGLSLLHGGYYPKATSRDTTAATFVAEAGVGLMDVDDVTMVIRCHPIRVAGESGPLPGETTWAEVAREAGLPDGLHERTTVTKRIRRVGTFDPHLVRRSISHNNPSRIVLNHLDYVDARVADGTLTPKARAFALQVERDIGRKLDWLGHSPSGFLDRSAEEGWRPANPR
jgi:adenylosuccinate synthase